MKKKKTDDDFWLDFKQLITAALKDVDSSPNFVTKIMNSVADTWGGQQVYICKRPEWKLSDRDRLVHSKFNGRNIAELCQEFDLSEVHIYSIIKRVQSEKQMDLFPKNEGGK